MADTPAIPEGLPLIEAGCTADDLGFANGADFWENLDEVAAGFGLDAALDRALAGRATPRVWVLVHEPGHPQLAAAAALGFARALADRGQAALVLDGDDHATALSRWAGREDAEGWIDIVRYGTSVLTSGVALPFAGRTAYLLGVGSYAPTDVTAEEIDQLLARLRRQADDLLVVLPGGTQAATWARRADIRLLCHDQAELTPRRLAAVVANLTDAGVAPTALVGFGRPGPAEAAAGETEAPPEPGAGPQDEADLDAAIAGLREDQEPEPAVVTAGPDAGRARRRGTSAVFWLAAAAAMVVIALLGVYYLKFVRVPADEPVVQAPAARPQPPAAVTGEPGGATGAAAVVDSQALVADGTAPGDSTAASPDSGSVALPADDGQTAAPPPAPAGTGPATAGADEAAAPGADAGPPPAEPVFDPAPYRVPVGTDGWALQVYSFRDSTSARTEMDRLARRGLRAAVRVVELPESGRWWRVYVGSFASRNAARAAEPALFRKLRIDWAQPSRFTVAVTDTAGG